MDQLDPARASVPYAEPRRAEAAGRPWRAIIDRCQRGEDAAWEEFLTEFQLFAQRRLRRQFQGLGPSDRADLSSATLERLLIAIRSGQIRGTTDAEIGAYLARAVRNQALDLVRRRRAELPLDDTGRHDLASDGGAYQRALVQKVTDVVSTWTPIERFLFVQKSHGVASEQIKLELELQPFAEFIDVATVDTRYHRLRGRLKSQLEC